MVDMSISIILFVYKKWYHIISHFDYSVFEKHEQFLEYCIWISFSGISASETTEPIVILLLY